MIFCEFLLWGLCENEWTAGILRGICVGLSKFKQLRPKVGEHIENLDFFCLNLEIKFYDFETLKTKQKLCHEINKNHTVKNFFLSTSKFQVANSL